MGIWLEVCVELEGGVFRVSSVSSKAAVHLEFGAWDFVSRMSGWCLLPLGIREQWSGVREGLGNLVWGSGMGKWFKVWMCGPGSEL